VCNPAAICSKAKWKRTESSTRVTPPVIYGEVGADWVKTSTGYGPSGATIDDLKLLRRHSPPSVQVKAAGGVRDLDKVLEIQALGVTRVGASKTKEILDDCRQRLGLPPIVDRAPASTDKGGY
jgi:deoxyribose-phosphate aldolase